VDIPAQADGWSFEHGSPPKPQEECPFPNPSPLSRHGELIDKQYPSWLASSAQNSLSQSEPRQTKKPALICKAGFKKQAFSPLGN
jgi:hypothetical protein